jgi:hypothetical protein
MAELVVWPYSLFLRNPTGDYMEALFRRFICRLLVVSTIMLPYSAPTQAAMIGTGQAIGSVEAQRGKVQSFVARADVQSQLAALGVEATAVSERVNALTDDEAQQVAGRIDTLPAGGVATEVALAIILILLLFIFVFDKKH